jgi:hypothetical protein
VRCKLKSSLASGYYCVNVLQSSASQFRPSCSWVIFTLQQIDYSTWSSAIYLDRSMSPRHPSHNLNASFISGSIKVSWLGLSMMLRGLLPSHPESHHPIVSTVADSESEVLAHPHLLLRIRDSERHFCLPLASRTVHQPAVMALVRSKPRLIVK